MRDNYNKLSAEHGGSECICKIEAMNVFEVLLDYGVELGLCWFIVAEKLLGVLQP
jgi:hypothetical protein